MKIEPLDLMAHYNQNIKAVNEMGSMNRKQKSNTHNGHAGAMRYEKDTQTHTHTKVSNGEFRFK